MYKMNGYKFDVEREYNNIIRWIREYFAENGPTSKAVIGISGGKDSTVAAALCVEALGPDRVVGVLMPQGEQADIDDALAVCSILGIEHYNVNIKTACDALYGSLNAAGVKLNDTATINTPPRIRMTTLYAVAASVSGRVCNTCNYSEDYVGYSTKYGDLAGDFGVLSKYTVEEVIKLGEYWAINYLNEENIDKMRSLIFKTPSDGLCGKTDEDNLGFTYKQLDDYIRRDICPETDILQRIYDLHKRNLHKKDIYILAPRPYVYSYR